MASSTRHVSATFGSATRATQSPRMALSQHTPASLLQDAQQLEQAVKHFAGRPPFQGLLRCVGKEARVARSLSALDAEPSSRVHAGIRESRLQGLANNLGGLRAELDVATKVCPVRLAQALPATARAQRSDTETLVPLCAAASPAHNTGGSQA